MQVTVVAFNVHVVIIVHFQCASPLHSIALTIHSTCELSPTLNLVVNGAF